MEIDIFDIKSSNLRNFRKYLLVDPTDKEERVMEGKMVIGMNKHREICTFQVTGSMLLLRDQVNKH